MLIQILDAIPKLFKLLDSDMIAIKREVCWILSLITAWDPQQIELVLGDPTQITKLIKTINEDDEKVFNKIFA